MSNTFYKQIIYSKARFTRILTVTFQSLERGTVYGKQEDWCCGETLIPIAHVYGATKISQMWLQCTNLLIIISPLIGIISVTLDPSLVSIRDMERSNVLLQVTVFFKLTEESILTRNPVNVISAVNPLQILIVFDSMKEVIVDENNMNVITGENIYQF